MQENTTFTSDELTYYSRHLSLEKIGIAGQTKLKHASVLCVGAGGLGCPVLMYLAAAGVGRIGIIDGDRIEISNLHRQVLYTQTDIGALKAEAAQQKLACLNPYIQLIAYPYTLTAENIFAVASSYDIVIDCSDNFATRYLINDACFYLRKPNVQASIAEFTGQCSIFTAKDGPCYRCLFDTLPPTELIPNCAQAGVLGVLPGILGSLQAIEVIKLIVEIGEPLIGKMLTVDALSMQFKEFHIQKNPECKLCQYQKPFHTLARNAPSCASETLEGLSPKMLKALQENQTVFILDVRDPHEYAICDLGGYLIPLSELPKRLGELDINQHIVVHCKKGPRSQTAIKILKAAGFKSVTYLEGGILAWREEIDPTLASY
jgi:sulfur-carrier protein adenylyltransferase/sulfurtransferase